MARRAGGFSFDEGKTLSHASRDSSLPEGRLDCSHLRRTDKQNLPKTDPITGGPHAGQTHRHRGQIQPNPGPLSRARDQAHARPADPERKDLAQEEYQQALEDLPRLERELQILLLPKDPNDGKNVIVEVRAGVGGEEAALFAHSLYRMYSMYAESRGWRTEVDSASETERGGL